MESPVSWLWKNKTGNMACRVLGGGHKFLHTVQFHLWDIIFSVCTGTILTIQFFWGFAAALGTGSPQTHACAGEQPHTQP